VDLDRDLHGCRTVWNSNAIAPTVVPKISLANGLVYTYTKPGSNDGSDYWYLTTLDFRTGRTVYRFRAGEGLGYNNNYAPITIGPDNGAVYLGVLGGMVKIRDATPPPRTPTGASGRPRVTLSTSYAGKPGCADGPVRATVSGRDANRIAFVDFLLGGRKVARDGTAPFAHTYQLDGGGESARYDLAARVKLVDSRTRTLHRIVSTCGGDD
jgi:hypothetical protein